jgi:phosphoribosylanthranilate isomerase
VTYVKICGCRSVEEALAARDAGADFIGLVFAESRRRVSVDTARRIADALRRDGPAIGTDVDSSCGVASRLQRLLSTRRPLLVGVFEGQRADEVESILERTGIDAVQLHGQPLSSPWVRVPIIRAVEGEDALNEMSEGADSSLLLLDGSRGRGKCGDWDSLAAAASKMPFILAGGLTPENVAEAIRRIGPWAVDVSSGVETGGRKDARKMQAFIAAAKEAIHDVSP